MFEIQLANGYVKSVYKAIWKQGRGKKHFASGFSKALQFYTYTLS